MERPNFDKDLSFGKKGERYILKKIKSKYPSAFIVGGYCKGYDIVVPETKIKVECKLDRLSYKTKNIAIEYEDKGMPSGIESTEANYWGLIFAHEEEWFWTLTPTEILHYLCRENGKQVGGGDNKQARMYLLPTGSIFYSRYFKINKC